MLKNKLSTLPNLPGCYQMKDKNGEIIYVGKAKNLKNRVNQYFVGSHDYKTTKMVSNVCDFDYIVTNSDSEAFLLEYNLIKKYRPRFNILLMDDSSYPYIRLTMEEYPTLKIVRDRKKIKNAKYFGPYPNVGYAREIVDILHRIYPLRRCKSMPSKVCLYYHIGQCLGPCEYKLDKAIFEELSNNIIKFINGDTKELKRELKEKIKKYSENLEFERASETKNLLDAIEHVNQKSDVTKNSGIKNIDVFNYYVENGYICIVGLLYRNAQLQLRHLSLNVLYDDPKETFLTYLLQYYIENDNVNHLVLPIDVEIDDLSSLLEIDIMQPSKGMYKKQLDLAAENGKAHLQQKFQIINKENTNVEDCLKQLSRLLNCSTTRIELYDNSHISGTNAIGAMVTYIDGKPSKKDYRLYNVHNEADDFANMKEMLYRRFFKSLKQEMVLPDLIIVDGGMNQINAAKEIINDFGLDVRICGLVKNEKHSTNSLMDEEYNIIDIGYESQLFFMLTNWQDEVHRFAISNHKKARSKQMLVSELDDISGVGNKRKNALLKEFKNINAIKNASEQQISKIVGSVVAKNIMEYFEKNGQK